MSKEKVLFPAWRYHKEQSSKIVQSAEEEKALGAGWYDSPAFNEPVAPPPPPKSDDESVVENMSKKELIVLLKEKGHKDEELKSLNKAELIELYEAK